MPDPVSILPFAVKDLSFKVEDKLLLEEINFSLSANGITAIIGPNGAGKSLLLRLCHGLLAPTQGSVTWNASASGRKRHAMVFQNPVMLRRSVRNNISHALHAVRHSSVMARTNAALERFGLSSLAEQPARLISGGEKQRLAIARAWALEPELLFLDEPTSQLDPGATRQIEMIISDLAKEGMTIIMATHDLGQARRLSERILFMHKSKLVEDANSATFFGAPKSQEAKQFIRGDLLW